MEWLSTSITAFCSGAAGQVDGRELARARLCTSRCILGGLPSSTGHGHVHRQLLVVRLRGGVFQHQLAFLGGGAMITAKRTAPRARRTRRTAPATRARWPAHSALASLLQISFGAMPDLFELHGAQVKARAAPGVVRQLWEGVGQAAAHPRRGWRGWGWPHPCAQQWLMISCARRSILGAAALHRGQSPARPRCYP